METIKLNEIANHRDLRLAARNQNESKMSRAQLIMKARALTQLRAL